MCPLVRAPLGFGLMKREEEEEAEERRVLVELVVEEVPLASILDLEVVRLDAEEGGAI